MNTAVGLGALVLLLLLPHAASATLLRPMDLGELARVADVVVRGRVLDVTPLRDEASGRIVTDARIEVIEAIVGATGAGEVLVVRQAGGTLKDSSVRVAGTAAFDPGEEVVVFVRRGQATCQLVGMDQGKLTVLRPQGTARVARGPRPHASIAAEAASQELPALDDFCEQVKRLRAVRVRPAAARSQREALRSTQSQSRTGAP